MIEAPPPSASLPTSSTIGSTGQRLDALSRTEADDPRLLASADRSRGQWRRLRLRLQSITPSGVARGLLVLGAASTVVWLLASAWFALVPFQVGLALAYITLPLVNRLDRVLPRVMAVALVVLLELGAVIAFIGVLIPPLAEQLSGLASTMPVVVDVRGLVEQLRAWVGTLPPQTQAFVLEGVSHVATFVRDNAAMLAQRIVSLLVVGSFTFLEWLGFVLGFLAIPTFLFAAMIDQPAGVRAINRALPSSVRADFWALARIVDRTLSSYLRGQLLRAAVFGTAIGAGLSSLDAMSNFQGTGYPLVFAAIAGVTYLIPTIGWLIGAIPAVLFGLVQSRETAVAVLALFAGAAFLETQVHGRRIERRSIDIHPFILMPALVVASQVNLLLVILAAPLLVVVRDLFRYIYGRLSDPPRPAGVMPERTGPIVQGRRPPATTTSRARPRRSGLEYPRPLDARSPSEEVTSHG
jgi:predicted PurR-regulated permease PerM